MSGSTDNNDADDIHDNGGDADSQSDHVERSSRSGVSLCYFPLSGHDGVPSLEKQRGNNSLLVF